MLTTPAGILALIALLCFVAAMVPTWPEKYLAPVGGVLLSVAFLVSLSG